MSALFQPALGEPADWLGDWHPLVQQLGSASGLVALADVSAQIQSGPVHDLASLRVFLVQYHQRVLVPIELPAIQRAFHHAGRRELRELIAFDHALALEPALKPFLEVSRRAGQTQLLKLRPMRDDRLSRRYREAVERGEASAWHTLVYGLTLSLYSMPLRQGLLGYGCQTTRGFIHAAARSLRLSEIQCRALLQKSCDPLPASVEALLSSSTVEKDASFANC
jgi:urease accessory protein UreF